MGPKELKLVRTEERLQEVDREYLNTVEAIAKKEHVISQKEGKILALQKQVRVGVEWNRIG